MAESPLSQEFLDNSVFSFSIDQEKPIILKKQAITQGEEHNFLSILISKKSLDEIATGKTSLQDAFQNKLFSLSGDELLTFYLPKIFDTLQKYYGR